MGEVYNSLGLFREGLALVRKTLFLQHNQPATRARQLLVLAEAQYQLGQYPEAASAFQNAIRLARSPDSPADYLLPRMLVGIGQTHTALGEYEAANASIREALRIDSSRKSGNESDLARDLEALGYNAIEAGDQNGAKPLIQRALALRLKAEGPYSPSVSDNMNALGQIAFLTGDMETAERYFRSRLKIDERVLGAQHPDVAVTLNNVGRTLIERRAFREATALLQRSVTTHLSQVQEEHDELVQPFSNLALAYRGTGRTKEAEVLMQKAIHAGRVHDHPSLPTILSHMAELHCRAGRTRSGLELITEARPLMATNYPDEVWRMAWLNNVAGECLLNGGQRQSGADAIRRSSPVILKRWRPSSFFGHEAQRRLERLGGGELSRPRPQPIGVRGEAALLRTVPHPSFTRKDFA